MHWGGTSSILWLKSILPPVSNTCSRDGLRAPGNNCDRVVLEVVVPGVPWTKIYDEGNLYLIRSIMDSSSTTLLCSLSIIRARGVLSYENQLPCLWNFSYFLLFWSGSSLLSQLCSTTELEHFWVEGSVVGGPVTRLTQHWCLISSPCPRIKNDFCTTFL